MKVVLGSAQFADRYGISNFKSSISRSSLIKIFNYYEGKKIFIDTAFNYKGSLETISKCNFNFKINLKIDIGQNKDYQKKFFNRVEHCLKLLKKKRVHSIMIHDTKNFIKLKSKDKAKLIKKLNILKKNKIINKIGFSIYDIKEIDYLEKIRNIDIVQVPLNIFDQSLIYKNKLLFLKKRNIEIHARSIFLQGLIFLNISKIEKVIGKKSEKLRNFCNLYKSNDERLYHSINFIKNCKLIDKTVIGFTSFIEFKKLINMFNKKKTKDNYNSFIIKDKMVIRPYNWKIKKL